MYLLGIPFYLLLGTYKIHLKYIGNFFDVTINNLVFSDQIHYSWTALHYAVLRDNPDCLKVLVRAGKICLLFKKFPICLHVCLHFFVYV